MSSNVRDISRHLHHKQLHFEIDSIVADLGMLRLNSLEERQRKDKPPWLPSRKGLASILEGISAVLFPNRLGLPAFTEGGTHYFVGHTLDVTLSKLYEQVRLELQFVSGQDSLTKIEYDHAKDITQAFASRLPKVRALLDSDIRAAYEGDPAATSVDEVLVCYPGITAITHHRITQPL